MSGIRIEDKPPSLAKGFTLPKTSDLPSTRKPWKYVKLPIDIMLLTVKDCEFLSCYNLLKNSFKSYTKKLGDVYFGGIGTGEPLKVALMKCQEGAIAPNGPIIVVQNAVTILQPKAVITVGYCSGLQRCTTRLGDVVVCSKITQYGPRIFQRGEVQSIGAARVPLSRDMLQLIREADAGWNPPLLDPSLREIKVHKDAEYLSGPEVVFDKQRYDELTRLYSNAKAIDMEGEGKIFYFQTAFIFNSKDRDCGIDKKLPKVFLSKSELKRYTKQMQVSLRIWTTPSLPGTYSLFAMENIEKVL